MFERDLNGIGVGGDERTRTADPLLAKQVLYQLSYVPETAPYRVREDDPTLEDRRGASLTRPVP
jgi:hypothetical protein